METQTHQPKPRVVPIYTKFPQGSPEWHQARVGNVTGSEAKDALYDSIGVQLLNSLYREVFDVKSVTAKEKETDRYLEFMSKDPLTLFLEHGKEPPEPAARVTYRRHKVAERLTGVAIEQGFPTRDMQWGTINEPLAKAKYALETGNLVTDAPFLLHPELRAGASPDGFVVERSTGLLGVVECKCLRTHNHLYDILRAGEIPEEYMVQIHMEIWISGRDFCDFIGFDSRLPTGLEIFVKRVYRDDKYIDTILEPQIRQFLEDVKKDETYFRIKIREEIERRKKEGIILLPQEVASEILV